MALLESPSFRKQNNEYHFNSQNSHCSFAKLATYVDSEIPLRISLATVTACWPLRDILHTTSQELVGQSDGPLGPVSSRVLAAELSEGDTMNPHTVRKAGVPRSPRLMLFFYDEWADSVSHLSKGDVLELVLPVQLVVSYEPPDFRPGDHAHCIVIAPRHLLNSSNIMSGLSPQGQEKILDSIRVTVSRRNYNVATDPGDLSVVITLTESILSSKSLPPLQSPRSRKSARARCMVEAARRHDLPASSPKPARDSSAQMSQHVRSWQRLSYPHVGDHGGYVYSTLNELFQEASMMSKKKCACWAIVLRCSQLQSSRGTDLFITAEITDQSLLMSSENVQTATVTIFAQPNYSDVLRNLVIGPGDLIRLHRFTPKLWENRLQLSGNIGKSGGAVYCLHPLQPPRPFASRVEGAGMVSLNAPQTEEGKGIAPPAKKCKHIQNEDTHIQAMDEKTGILPEIPIYSIYKRDKLQHVHYSVIDTLDGGQPARRALFLSTQSSATSTQPCLPTLSPLFDLSFAYMASKKRPPELGIGATDYSEWIRISEIPALVQDNIRPVNQQSLSTNQRLKNDVICMVTGVIVEHKVPHVDNDDHERLNSPENIKSITLRCWDGSGASSSQMAMSFVEWVGKGALNLDVQNEHSIVATRSVAAGLCLKEIASGKYKNILSSEVLPQVDEMSEPILVGPQIEPTTDLFELTTNAFFNLSKDKALDAQRNDGVRTANIDPLERSMLKALMPMYTKATTLLIGPIDDAEVDNLNAGTIHGNMLNLKLDVGSLVQLQCGCLTPGVSCLDLKQLRSLCGEWVRLSCLQHVRSASSEHELLFDAESVCELMPSYAYECRVLLAEYEESVNRLPHHIRFGLNRNQYQQLQVLPTEQTTLIPAQNVNQSHATWRLQQHNFGRFGYCLAEILATPFPDRLSSVALVTAYYPNTFSQEYNQPLAQQRGTQWYWMIALTLLDESSELTCIVLPSCAEKLLGTCQDTSPHVYPKHAELKAKGILQGLLGRHLKVTFLIDFEPSPSMRTSKLCVYVLDMEVVQEV